MFVMSPCVSVTFPNDVSDQVWYLNGSIPDPCFLYYFHSFEIILSHKPIHTRSSDHYVSSLSEKSVPHRYQCEKSVTNTRPVANKRYTTRNILAHDCILSKTKDVEAFRKFSMLKFQGLK